MAADLGTWRAEQATVLLEVLHTAGLHPEARRTRGEVHVTVPDEEGDRANATLVAQMDAIARAARPAPPPRGTRRLRAVESPSPRAPGRRGSDRDERSGRGKGTSKRAGGVRGVRRGTTGPPSTSAAGARGLPIAIGAAGFTAAFASAAVGSGPTFPLVVMTGLLVWVLGKRAERGI